MTVITGDLRLVSDRPAEVTQVHVRARETRAEDGGLTLGKPDTFPVHGGFLDISVLPGPAFLVLVYVGGAVESIPILVADLESESLENVANAAKVATSDNKEWLEKLAAEVIAGTQGPKGDTGPTGAPGTSVSVEFIETPEGSGIYTIKSFPESAIIIEETDPDSGLYTLGVNND